MFENRTEKRIESNGSNSLTGTQSKEGDDREGDIARKKTQQVDLAELAAKRKGERGAGSRGKGRTGHQVTMGKGESEVV